MPPSSVLTVSQLNRHIKNYLEQEIGTVHVEGELSNLSKPSSGHFYFTLKDQGAQIRCVFFKNRHNTPLAKELSDGQHIVASGTLSLYEARGDYQLIIERLEKAGLGALYQQFELLKNKLAAEGLFLSERKKSLPKIPTTIGIITSASGAAIQDILSTLARRYPLATVLIYPSEVQGATAAQQLIKALQRANEEQRCDVLILARGGGSIEDLWAFNNEHLARQIALSSIPIVSGVGHETDFTIADFVANYRAETPTAAAAAVTPDANELIQLLLYLQKHVHSAIAQQIQQQQLKLKYLSAKIASPHQAIAVYWQRLDYLERQLLAAINNTLKQKHHHIQLHSTQLQAQNPLHQLQQIKKRMSQIVEQLHQQILLKVTHLRYQLNNQLSTLHAVSPLATLDRGYSIACKEQAVLFTTQQVRIGDTIDVRLSEGALTCKVLQVK